jgi:hypothetical protein
MPGIAGSAGTYFVVIMNDLQLVLAAGAAW